MKRVYYLQKSGKMDTRGLPAGASVMKNAVNKKYANASKYFISHPQGLDGHRISDKSVPPKMRGISMRQADFTLSGGGLGGAEETPQNARPAGALRHAAAKRKAKFEPVGQIGSRLKQLSKMGFAQEKRGKDLRDAAFSQSRSMPWPTTAGVNEAGVPKAKAVRASRKKRLHFGDVERIHSGTKDSYEKMMARRLKREPKAHFLNPYHNRNPYAHERRPRDNKAGFVERLAKLLSKKMARNEGAIDVD